MSILYCSSDVNHNIQLSYLLTSYAQDLRQNPREESKKTQTAVTPEKQKDSIDTMNTSQIVQRPPLCMEAKLQYETDGDSDTPKPLDEIDNSLAITKLTVADKISFGPVIQVD